MAWEQISLDIEPDVTIKLTLLLDNSASMQGSWSQTLDGVVEYFKGLTSTPNVKYQANLVCFADNIIRVFEDVGLQDIDYKAITECKANGLSTSLYDAIGTELKRIDLTDQANLVIVFTDGKDNSSKTYTAKSIKALRESLEAKGNYTFVFLGANPDVWEEAKASAGTANSRIFDKNTIRAQLSSVKSSTNVYSAKMSMNVQEAAKNGGILTRSVANFFEDKDTVSSPNTKGS